jgi:excisionase family DNA binding protein
MSDLLTVSEVARILRVDDATVRRWVKQGVLEAVVLPHVHSRQVYRIKRETLERVLGESDTSQSLLGTASSSGPT